MAVFERARIRELAASRAVEHTRHGSTWMTTGRPDPACLPESYAHVGGPQVRGLLDAIEADPGAVARGMLDSGFVVAGTPSDVFPTLDALRDVGVDQVIVHMQMGGVPHAEIMRSIAIMGREVIPRYA